MKTRFVIMMIAVLLALPALPSCRRAAPPPPSLNVQASLVQVTETHLLPGEVAVGAGKSYLVGTPEVVVTFRFPEAMDRGSVGAALAVTPALEREIQWTDGNVLQLRLAGLPLDRPVEITLAGGARATSGATTLPFGFTVLRNEPPRVVASVEGQPGVTAPGMYRLLAGRKTIRLDFTRAMDRGAVEQMLLTAIDPRCQPALRWESDELAHLDLDLLQGLSVRVSFLGWPDHRGVPVIDPAPLVLEGVGTVQLARGTPPDHTVLTTLLDQFQEGSVSPDGRRVALLERFTGQDEAQEVVVWALDLGTKGLTRLGSFTDYGQFAASWLPDSRHLVVNTGSNLVELDATGREGPRELLEPADRTLLGMAVAPRSGRIACFVAAGREEGAALDLLITGKGTTTTYPAVSHLYSREGFWVPVACAWSSDESAIAFADLRTRNEAMLTLIDPEKGGTRVLGGQAEFLAFSPSGRELAVRNPDGSWDLVDTGDGSRTPLVPAQDACAVVFWAPGGERACFGRPEGGLLVWDREQGTVATATRGIPLGWLGSEILWLTP
ncbi:MAG: hypothetical protein H5U04_02550 [Firmicutes bacterium]|nr:hypothetical protein [Bacillota bacterium]